MEHTQEAGEAPQPQPANMQPVQYPQDDEGLVRPQTAVNALLDLLMADNPAMLCRMNHEQYILMKNDAAGKFLFAAARHGKWDSVLYLVYAARLYPQDLQDRDGWTLLHHAVVRHANAAVARLLRGLANVYLADRYGRTALALAALYGRMRLARLLVEAGSNCRQRDLANRSPVEVAASQGHTALAKYLRTK